jgi:hypothetical protein
LSWGLGIACVVSVGHQAITCLVTGAPSLLGLLTGGRATLLLHSLFSQLRHWDLFSWRLLDGGRWPVQWA